MKANKIQNSLENRLISEKVNPVSLSDAYKNQLTQKVLDACQPKESTNKVVSIFSYRILVLVALFILSFSLLFLNQEKVVVTNNPNVATVVNLNKLLENFTINPHAISISIPKTEVFDTLSNKLNPDLIGSYASLIYTIDTNLTRQYQAEFNAIGSFSNKILTNFYDEFKPVKHTEEN